MKLLATYPIGDVPDVAAACTEAAEAARAVVARAQSLALVAFEDLPDGVVQLRMRQLLDAVCALDFVNYEFLVLCEIERVKDE